ncbi:MAG: hypothetical protein ACOY3X_11555 [Pseudomonadota bacterium]
MARILMGWELGGGFGHITNILTLGRALRDQGHEVLFALKDTVPTWPLTRDAGFPVLAAPVPRMQPIAMGKRFLARTFADVLIAHGYHQPEILEPQVSAWKALIDLARPDLVISEFSPSLCLAAWSRVPSLAFGIGFCAPCLQRDGRFPVLESNATALLPQERLMEGVADTMKRMGLPVPANPLDALLGNRCLAIGLDEIDPYRAARTEPGVGPLWELPAAEIPMPEKPYCLVYLPGEHPALREIVEGLAALKTPGVVFLRGGGPAARAALSRTVLEVSAKPVDMAAMLPKVSVVVHHAGTGTVERAMAWGRPQVLSPIVLEQGITSRNLARLGTARVAADTAGVQQLAATIDEVAVSVSMRSAAQNLAGRLRQQYPRGSLEKVTGVCAELLAG